VPAFQPTNDSTCVAQAFGLKSMEQSCTLPVQINHALSLPTDHQAYGLRLMEQQTTTKASTLTGHINPVLLS
jgi:hypothetical protein